MVIFILLQEILADNLEHDMNRTYPNRPAHHGLKRSGFIPPLVGARIGAGGLTPLSITTFVRRYCPPDMPTDASAMSQDLPFSQLGNTLPNLRFGFPTLPDSASSNFRAISTFSSGVKSRRMLFSVCSKRRAQKKPRQFPGRASDIAELPRLGFRQSRQMRKKVGDRRGDVGVQRTGLTSLDFNSQVGPINLDRFFDQASQRQALPRRD